MLLEQSQLDMDRAPVQIAPRQSETIRDRVEIRRDPTHTYNNNHDSTRNDICIYIGTHDNHEQTDCGRADISE